MKMLMCMLFAGSTLINLQQELIRLRMITPTINVVVNFDLLLKSDIFFFFRRYIKDLHVFF